MKFLVALCVLAFVALSSGDSADPKPGGNGCQYIAGKCWKQCEEGTSSYTPGCGSVTPEATCDQPKPVPGRGDICDYSACYCDAPTVRDTESGKCVKIEDCPPKKDQEDKKSH